MRSRCIGVVPPKDGWRPRFAKRNAVERKPDGELGQRKTQVMSYFPTQKGAPRMERLRHYWHVDMAILLETDPSVRFWTTEVEAVQVLDADHPLKFTPHIWIVGRNGNRAVSLVDGDDAARERRLERYPKLRPMSAEDGPDLMVVTREEVEKHPFLEAAKTILYHRRWEVPEEYVLRVAAIIDSPPATLGALHSALDPDQGSWPQVLALIGQGLVEIEMFGQLDPTVSVVACLARDAN